MKSDQKISFNLQKLSTNNNKHSLKEIKIYNWIYKKNI